jgi:predicted transposase YbfD/YdcC
MLASSLTDHCKPLHDPRQQGKVAHSLHDMIVIAVCAVICGAQNWTDIADIGRERLSWFRSFMPLPNGIPSHDTFGTVFAMLDPAVFEECFVRWVASSIELTEGSVVSVDGKTLRGSFDRRAGISPLHMVSAFVAGQSVVLGQLATEEKSNEITAIPVLLEMLFLKGCIVTIDAMGTQTEIASTIRKKGADYVLPVKANQPTLHNDILAWFDKAFAKQWRGIEHSFTRTVDSGHGRIETRSCWALCLPTRLQEHAERWCDLRTIACVEAIRELPDGSSSTERRYFISSCAPQATDILSAVRAHWSIENGLHWKLDVQMREDECRIRGDAAEIFAVLRHIALNKLNQEKSYKRSVRSKQIKACLNDDYLQKVVEI